MNRMEFMHRLSFLLADIPENERLEAIQYYEDYLNDADVESEEEVLAELGTPEELAASIREGLLEGAEAQGIAQKPPARRTAGGGAQADSASSGGTQRTGACGGSAQRTSAYGGSAQNTGAYSGSARRTGAYGSSAQSAGANSASSRAQCAGTEYRRAQEAGADLDRRYRGRRNRSGMSGGMVALVVILCVLAAPVVVPVVFALVVVLAVLAFVAVLLAGIFLFVGVICIAAGIVALVGSVAKVFLYPAGAVLAIGISLLTIGTGILLLLLIGWLISRAFPKAFQGLTNFAGRIFHKKGGNAA